MSVSRNRENWSIGEVADRAGLNPSAIRYYESIGLLPKAERISGQRRYGDSVLKRLAVIELARRAGFTLAETRTLLNGFSAKVPPSARWRALADRKLPEIEALIARASAMKRLLEEGLDCDCLSLDDCGLLLAGDWLRRSAHRPSARATSGSSVSR
jgi:MerR family transcriptional regulator, redox-sensitive transcriptional activator SoxR